MACSPAGLFLLRCRIGILRWLANPLTTVITAAVDAFNVFAVTEAIGELSSSDGNELGFRLLIAAALFTGLGFLSAIAGGVVSHISVDGIAACFAVAATFNFPADGIASLRLVQRCSCLYSSPSLVNFTCFGLGMRTPHADGHAGRSPWRFASQPSLRNRVTCKFRALTPHLPPNLSVPLQ